jgi:tetratricopeptide (TPR) repeat protein
MVTEVELDYEMVRIAKALRASPIDHITALSAASGVTDQQKVDRCRGNIDGVVDRLRIGLPTGLTEVLEHIFLFYRSGQWIGSDELSFPSAVENFVDPDIGEIGNCMNRAAIFYVLAHRLGAPVGLMFSVIEQHASIRTLEDAPVIIDPNEGIRGKRYDDEEDVDFANYLGLYYLNRLDASPSPEEKAQLCKSVLMLSPDRPEGYSELATVHIKYGGNPDIAVRLCLRAVELSNHPAYRGNLAVAYNFVGRNDLALQEIKILKRDFPSFEHLPKFEAEVLKQR